MNINLFFTLTEFKMAIPDDKLKEIISKFELHLGKAVFSGMKTNSDKINQVFSNNYINFTQVLLVTGIFFYNVL